MPMHRKKMKILWILLAASLTDGDKLDRGYLPPPGAHLSGGLFNDDKLELPKETFPYINSYELDNSGYKSTPNTTPDVRTTSYDGNIETTEYVLPVSLYDSYINYSSTTPILSQVFTQTTTDPSQFEYSSDNPTQMTTNHDSMNGYYDPYELYNHKIINQLQNEFVHTATDFPDILKSTTEKTIKENQSLTDSSKIKPSLTIKNVKLLVSEEIPNNDFLFTTPSSETDSTILPNNSFKYLSTNKPKFGSIKNILSKLNSYIPSIQASQSLDTSTKFPERTQTAGDRNAIIINYDNKFVPGGFSYSFDTSNGIHADESGTAASGVKAKGSYSYVGDDGKLYSIEYTADENGFQPRGSHLPTSPPIPKEIQKVIDQAYKNKNSGIYFDDGSYDERKYGYKKYMPHLPYKAQEPNLKKKNYGKTRGVLGVKAMNRSDLSIFETDPSLLDSINTNRLELGANQANNYELTTPSLKYNKVSSSDGYPSTISTVNAPTTQLVPKLYTSKTLDASDDRTNTELKHQINHDSVISIPQDSSRMPTSITELTSTEHYNVMIPDNSDDKHNNVFGEDFSGAKRYQNFDHRTGYYY